MARGGWAAALASMAVVFTAVRLRRFYAVNFLIYIAIFGFFRSYPMYLVDRFHLGVSAVSEFVAWVGVPIVLANLGVTGWLTRLVSVRRLTIWSAALTGICMVALSCCRVGRRRCGPSCSAPPRRWRCVCPPARRCFPTRPEGEDQGRVMGSNQAIQVGAEALSGVAAGLLAAVVIKLPLVVLGGTAVVAAAPVMVVV